MWLNERGDWPGKIQRLKWTVAGHEGRQAPPTNAVRMQRRRWGCGVPRRVPSVSGSMKGLNRMRMGCRGGAGDRRACLLSVASLSAWRLGWGWRGSLQAKGEENGLDSSRGGKWRATDETTVKKAGLGWGSSRMGLPPGGGRGQNQRHGGVWRERAGP